ncbi:MAG: SRPBCC domain-containing protein [Paracoccaceae bacterium]
MSETLQATATGSTDILFVRDFHASPALVWRALTEPALLTVWLWARDIPMTTCQMDLRVGGAFRWVWTRPDGTDMGVSGRFLEIDAPHLLVNTEVFDDDWTSGETTVKQHLTLIDEHHTRLRIVVRYSTAAARDLALASPMTEGMEDAYGKLDTLLRD